MILLIGAIILGIALLVWLWKVPVKKIVTSLKESGSSAFEAYTIVLLLLAGLAATVYMIARVV